jgi:hypothetical protein
LPIVVSSTNWTYVGMLCDMPSHVVFNIVFKHTLPMTVSSTKWTIAVVICDMPMRLLCVDFPAYTRE